jgi:hypothetical protein
VDCGTAAGAEHADRYREWGVVAGPWLWTTRLRILFVLDGRIDTSEVDGCFGLGLVIRTLLDDSFAWWVSFEVDVVRRDDGSKRKCPASVLFENTRDFNFRFTKPGFNLDDYDQVWFFGDYPGNEPNDPADEDYSPLTDAELKVLAEWMDRGGGVSATGDHYNLGASMCSRIPRVRTMRRWTVDQGVPPQFGDSRNQTLQSAPGTEDAREGDPFAQPIEPVYESTASSVLVRSLTPHPLLCSRAGVIDRFPDHMHEGEVIDDDEVELDRPLDIPGYSGAEYPLERPENLPTGVTESVASPAELPRPHPHVIAYGRTTHVVIGPGQDVPDQEDPLPRLIPFRRRFGLVGVYDGDAARIGRVVVDSTWHHWFSLNLHGLRDQNRPVYEGMQAYYRNIGLWLATPAQRASMLFAATWGAVVSDPMAFPVAGRGSLWATGERALDVIGRTASQCTVSDLVGAFFRRGGRELFGVPGHVHPSDPYPSALPADLVVRAIVGGIATAFLEPSLEYHRAQRGGRRLLDPEAIARQARKGVELGYEALSETTRSSAEAVEELTGRLTEGFRPLDKESISIPVELVPVRIVAERVQLTDLTDPALVGGRFEITARLWLAGSIVANEVIEAIEVPQLESQGAFAALDRILFEGVAQTGENLVVELIAGSAGGEHVEAERVRFRETLTGPPSTWLGSHTPSREQEWRLWFRVERGDAADAE